ncbi:MAG: hypothetical protein IIA59_04415 [Candidatus Marinimicrobia bacterium]|nr:hypothetical protein [Candidatus Neomarinimicrobiota bacterium]
MIAVLVSACLEQSFAQDDPDPQQGIGGDRRFRKWGQMDGNLINTPFINMGMVGNWPANPDPSEWPKGSGHTYVEGATPIIIAEIIDVNGDTLHIAEVGYREDLDTGPDGTPYGYEPRPGWDNPDGPSPAMSNDPNTWPFTWPDKTKLADDPGWPGAWNGFFGKNQFQADLETYFVMDDYQDREFIDFNRPQELPYFPVPSEPDRGGLATLVAVRGLQWSQVLAEDNIFWLYRVTNFSVTDYTTVFFGMYFDYGIGGVGDSSDDSAFYDTFIDIVYGWDEDNTGNTGFSPTAYAGFAFLESPGEQSDGVDNDEDGWIDERRDNPPGEYLDVFPYGYSDVANFIKTYGREPAPHWEGDEDGDWQGFSDDNGDGVWGPGENINDDVGRDGARFGDLGYTGPDEGEGDGLPTQGEPNFGITDIDESDQIGLTSVDIFDIHWINPSTDEKIWVSMSEFTFNTDLRGANMALIYGSGPISPFRAGTTQNLSIAMIFGNDLDDLFRNKKTVQQIYNANYNFFKPPLKPRLTAVPGDGKVTLYWDRRAESSVDAFLNFKEDFEGYKVYRSTEASFLEIKLITDAYGNAVFRKPLASFDLIDGIMGPDPVTIAGASFDRGTDSGLRHFFVDSTVQNGQTYFYAVTAYDQGDPGLGEEGIPVTETTSIIKTDAFGNVTFTDINTAVVTPNSPAAGYLAANFVESVSPVGTVLGTGSVSAQIVNTSLIKNSTYRISFKHSGVFETESYAIIDVSASPDTILQTSVFGADEKGALIEGEIFDGLRLFVTNHDEVALVDSLTGWAAGSNTNFEFKVNLGIGAFPYPADYDIAFFDGVIGTDSSSVPKAVNFTITNVSENRPVKFTIKDLNEDGLWSSNEQVRIREIFDGVEEKTWLVTITDTIGGTGSQAPRGGDMFQITTFKPFRSGDVFEFTTAAASVDRQLAISSLDLIAVVPNPYVAVATWERKQTTSSGIGSRGERRIDFIHLPQVATIRIYTIRGDLVDVIEHSSSIDNSAASWDLRTKEGLDVAFGIYVYHVDAKDLGEKIGKFAIIK